MEECLLCKICNGDIGVEVVFSHRQWIVVKCPTCNEYMIVLKKHKADLTNFDRIDVINIAKFLCPDYNTRNIDWSMSRTRKKDHFYAYYPGMRELIEDKQKW